MYRTWQRAAALVFKPRCLVCCRNLLQTKPANWARHPLGDKLCANCLPAVNATQTPRCLRCGLKLGPKPQSFGWTHCRHCKNRPDLGARQTVVCADYQQPFDDWVSMLKYGKQWQIGQLFGQWLGHELAYGRIPKPDVLIPVPCSTAKLKARGYNQAATIAKALSRATNTPMHLNWLVKVADSSAQASLNKDERAHNLQGAFRVNRAIAPQLVIGLVDDVITTGATVDECERILRKAGAGRIVVFAACRTPEY